jgi:hypothetical protein
MDDINSSVLQDFIGTAANLTPTQPADSEDWTENTADDDDMEFEPSTEAESEEVGNEAFLERFLEEQNEEEDEDSDGILDLHSI